MLFFWILIIGGLIAIGILWYRVGLKEAIAAIVAFGLAVGAAVVEFGSKLVGG